MLKILNKEISILTESLVKPIKKNDVYIDTCFEIFELSISKDLDSAELALFEIILKKFDINNKLYLFYDDNEKKASETLIDVEPYGLLFICLIFKQILFFDSNLSKQKAYRYKKFNVLFKSIDQFDPQRIKISNNIYDLIDKSWDQLSSKISAYAAEPVKCEQVEIYKQEQIIPITVLFYEGPIGRAFLSSLKLLNLKPQKIISIIPSEDLFTKNKLGTWLPGFMKMNYITTIQKNKIHYWPRLLEKKYPEIVSMFRAEIKSKFGFSVEAQVDSTSLKPLDEFSPNIESILIKNLSDDALLAKLSGEKKSSILYTGGGIMPLKLLDLEHLRFIHIHPGFLPEVRGADCLLWSNLIYGQSSASSFYMAKGIDTGDILKAKWLPILDLNLNGHQIDGLSMYRMIYSFIDPWVRSVLLKDLVTEHSDFFEIHSTSQNSAEGLNFHFMHQKLRSLSLKSMF